MKPPETLPITLSDTPLTDAAKRLIEAGDAWSREMEALEGDDRIPAFTATSGLAAWRGLTAVRDALPECGERFCEWGSGTGLVSCVADLLGWQATGLEIEPRLVEAARRFAKEQVRDAAFHVASYKPDGFPDKTDALDTGHGFGLFDFDVIFAYTWPAEVETVTAFIANNARPGTLFLRYRGGMDFTVFRIPE